MQKNTHIFYDGNKILKSPDLRVLFGFLSEIDKETESFLELDNKLETIRNQYSETIRLILEMARKLREHSIDFRFNLLEHPATMADKLEKDSLVRSKFIVLFANLETLLCLNIAYDNKKTDKKSIIKMAMNQEIIMTFLGKFCLTEKNEWGNKNRQRLEKISAVDLRRLRNSLTHFFSVDEGLSIADAILDEKSRKLEIITEFKVKFISPEDLHQIVRGAGLLMIKMWNDDYLESRKNNSKEFKQKIMCVNNVVKDYGAVAIKSSQINI